MRVCRITATAMITAASLVAEQAWIGDYNSELRRGNRVDVELMAERLQDLGVNTYMWLVWHSPHDWKDLSRRHDNLVGYVMDDFWGNVTLDWFTPAYVREMVEAGKTINPEIMFYVLLYPSWGQIGPDFARSFGTIVDGVVAAYPRDRVQVEEFLPYLNDTFDVPATFGLLGTEGLDLRDFGARSAWRRKTRGAFAATLRPSYEGTRRFELPVILMTAAQPTEYRRRWQKTGTPQRIAEKVRLALELVHDGTVQGVVTYCLDKTAGSESYSAVKAAIAEFRERGP